MDLLTEAKQKLINNGYKVTVPRKIMLEFLEQEGNKHLSCDEIYERMSSVDTNVGIATIYRNMQLFEDLGIVSKLQLEDGIARYELAIGDHNKDHHHLICSKCGNMTEMSEDPFDIKDVENKYDFDISDYVLKFYGTCAKCRER